MQSVWVGVIGLVVMFRVRVRERSKARACLLVAHDWAVSMGWCYRDRGKGYG